MRRRTHNSNVRRSSGASIILVALAAVGLGIIVYLAFQFIMVMGGSRQVRNAVDAAALNVSKQVVGIKVPTDQYFKDCADTSGAIGMSNLCRVWGKAMLINANVQEMTQSGQIGNGSSAGDISFQAAQQINDQLCSALSNKSTLDNYFKQISTFRTAQMLGQGATVSTTGTTNGAFATAMVDRGAESNLDLYPQQIPKGVNITSVKRGNNYFVKGYTPISVNNKEFVLASFPKGDMPHLISENTFGAGRGKLPSNPIPNAFLESGLANGNNTSLMATACAEANPMRQYTMAIPYAYVTIQFNNMSAWYVEGKKVFEQPYGYDVETVWGVKKKKLSDQRILDGYASLGNEYKAGNIWQLYTKLPGDHETALQKMLQRIQEIDPTYTRAKLVSLMTQTLIQTGQTGAKYFIYPVYTSADCTNPTMKMSPMGGSLPPWLIQANAAEGAEAQVSTENPVRNEPNYCWPVILPKQNPEGHYTTFEGTIGWQPGTGLGQCLGNLHLARTTRIYFTITP